MLHEMYAPADSASVVWSRQKKSGFLRLLSDMYDGAQQPSVLLLYGPTGSGKLSSAQAMLREQRDAYGRPTLVEVMHTCEAAPQEYYQFLMDTFTEHETVDSNACVSTTRTAATIGGDSTSAVGDGLPTGAAESSAVEIGASQQQHHHHLQCKTRRVARVVKFYGEPLMSHLHTLTRRFLDHYSAWRCASPPVMYGGGGGGGGGTDVGNVSLLQRHLVLFIATTHDTHSDKVALGMSFPPSVLTHPSIQTFHCTPLTTRNMAVRIKDIMQIERRRKNRGVGGSLSDEDIEFLCEHSHGDIRHALLQLQWYLLGERVIPRCLQDTGSAQHDKKRPRFKSKVTNMMDLLDDGEGVSDTQKLLPPLEKTSLGTARDTRRGGTKGGGGAAMIFRDEYLDVAHATARILTQKYTMASVLEELNVEPSKLLGYLTNNMSAYFRPEQMEAYAPCAAAASFADALRAAGSFSGRWRRAGTGLHTARLTSDDDNDGAGAIGLDLVSLVLFGKTYVACHKDVHIPRAFVAQRPPPYQPSVYPRLREVRVTRKRARVNNNGYDGGNEFGRDTEHTYSMFSSESEWRQDFLRRLQLRSLSGGPPSGQEFDIVRESLPALVNRCASLDTVLLEYLPYARFIVLDYAPPSVNSCVSGRNKVALANAGASPSKRLAKTVATHAGPKKTMFSLIPVSSSPLSHRLPKRTCSLLRYNILCLGLPGKSPVRVEYFTLVTHNATDDCDEGETVDDATDPNAPRPLLPDGEDIEEYSD